ncbi:MAG TPA: RDD family protein [Candidatus Competibacteraceae bacterium]|nr:RDD family protein [Candidatus Competibacteraceae bacterium]HRZ05298.1 RDD family protein [Candidatus Competibacteraceae bacterium]
MTFHTSPPSHEGEGLAKLPRRLAAIVYDGLLLIGVLIAATGLAMGMIALVSGSGESVKAGGSLTHNPFFQTYLLLICFFFYGGFWVHGGQTLGLRAWRLRLQRRDGGNIRWQQALLRFLSGGLWLVAMMGVHQALKPGIGWSLGVGLSALLLLLALRLPDRWAETELVVVPKTVV